MTRIEAMRSAPRFTSKERRAFRGYLKKHYTTKPVEELVTEMIEAGFTKPSGAPLDKQFVVNQASMAGIRKRRKKRVALSNKAKQVVANTITGKTSEGTDKDVVIGVVLGSNLDRDTKLKIIGSLL